MPLCSHEQGLSIGAWSVSAHESPILSLKTSKNLLVMNYKFCFELDLSIVPYLFRASFHSHDHRSAWIQKELLTMRSTSSWLEALTAEKEVKPASHDSFTSFIV